MSNGSKCFGVDVGTMFFQIAEMVENNKVEIKTVRNSFVEMPKEEDVEDELKKNNWQFVKDNNDFYVIGEDSIRVANLFPTSTVLRRPLADGVLNKDENKGLLVLTEIIKRSIGIAPDDKSFVCTCISSESADGAIDSKFHSARLQGIMKNFGWNIKVIEEAEAVIKSEKPISLDSNGEEIPYTGIGLSFGAGRVNCVLAFRGKKIIGMSCARSGDWIDKCVADALGKPISQVTRKKETKLDFNNIDESDDVLFALDVYYSEMIKYVFNKFAEKFRNVKSDFDGAKLEIVVAGGTSMPNGFCNRIKKVINEMKLPFEVKDVRHSSDPRNSVVRGLLLQSMISRQKFVNGA